MPRFIKQTFIVLVLVLLGFDGSLVTKYLYTNNQSCMIKPTLFELSPDKLHYYSFIHNLDRCDGNWNPAEDPFGRARVPNKIDYINLEVFNMIKGMNESKNTCKAYSM